MLGTITLPISIFGCKFSTKLYVMDGAHSDVYLGMPFLQQNSAILAFDGSNKHTLSLLKGIRILAHTHLELAPYTETVVPGALQVPVPQYTSGCVFPWEGSEAKGFAVAYAEVLAYHCAVPVRLNCQPFKISIHKGERIASFQIFDTETEYLPYKHSGHIDSVGSEIQDPNQTEIQSPRNIRWN